MSITIDDPKSVLLGLLIIAVIVLVVFIIIAVANLIKSLKSLTKVLSDVEIVTHVAQERTKQIDHVLDDVTKTVAGVTTKVKGNDGIIKSISIIASAAVAIKNVLANKSKENSATKTNAQPKGKK